MLAELQQDIDTTTGHVVEAMWDDDDLDELLDGETETAQTSDAAMLDDEDEVR
jgi:hypothetical protein